MKHLKEFRAEKGMSQQAVADYLGITRQAYCNYENGNREPDFEMLLKLGEFYETSVDSLLRGPETQKAPTEVDEYTDLERELIRRFRSLNRQGRDFVLQCLTLAEASYAGDNTIPVVEKTV